jgi:hypothetical protein
MTLQELHELIGKVLKERPELADVEAQVAVNNSYYELQSVTHYNYPRGEHVSFEAYCLAGTSDEKELDILWQAN